MKLRNSAKPIQPASMTPDAYAALGNAGSSRRDFLRTAGVMIVAEKLILGR